MPTYIELQSEFDHLPDSFSDRLMTTKEDVVSEIDYRIKTIYDTSDSHHSMKYYSLLKDLIISFRNKLTSTVLPSKLPEWWRYSYEISHKGVCLYVEHIDTLWLEEGTDITDDEIINQTFLLVSYDARMLTVDEYAKLYSVEPVTVRQWIRRGKLREAEKIGKEWQISELIDIPGRASYKPSFYKWIPPLKDVPAEFTLLNDYSHIEIIGVPTSTKKEPSLEFHAILSSKSRRSSTTYLPLSNDKKDRLEKYLISSPAVLFSGMTYYYAFKHEKQYETEEEEGDEL